MKKIILVLIFILMLIGGYFLYNSFFNNEIPLLNLEEKRIDIDELYIYGTHLNIHGNIVDDTNLDFVLYNGDFISKEINLTDDGFNLSNEINNGLYLEDIPVGTYYAFLRSRNKDENDEDVYRYYAINNISNYNETIYYTFSNIGNKIVINSDNETYNTLMFTVSKNKDEDIYDVVVDPGHGGVDGGAHKYGYDEADITMDLALELKEKLEAYGVRVKLTREKGQLKNDEKLNDYNLHGRAIISHELHAKYVFSIHLNSSSSSYVNGLEIYAANNANYDFAKKLANNIVKETKTNYSVNKINKKYDGIYTRVFTDENIASSRKEYLEKDMIPYDVTKKSNYYFMIRETGGIMTGAYVDDRNKDIIYNPYYNSNIGTEAYLLELGYLSNKNDLDNILNNSNKYTDAISNTFKEIFIKE